VDCACKQAALSPTTVNDLTTIRRNAIGGTLPSAQPARIT